MIYKTDVLVNNKISIVISDNEEQHEKTLSMMKEHGGMCLQTKVQENYLGEVIVNYEKATAATAASTDFKEIVKQLREQIKNNQRLFRS